MFVIQIDKIINVLRAGGVIIYPTDTLFGLGSTIEYVQKVFEIKGRNPNKPASLAFSNIKMIEKYAHIENYKDVLRKYLPGPYTFLIPAKIQNKYVVKNGLVGIRIPDHEYVLSLIEKLGEPVTATSANISGGKSPAKFEEIDPKILEKVDTVIDLPCKYGQQSTVVDLVNKKILRQGVGEFQLSDL